MKTSKQRVVIGLVAGVLALGAAGLVMADTYETTAPCMVNSDRRMVGPAMMSGMMHRSDGAAGGYGMMRDMMDGVHGMMHHHETIHYKDVAQAERPLAIPPILQPEEQSGTAVTYRLTAQAGTAEFLDTHVSPTKGYNGSLLGPVIRLQRGQTVTMKLANALQEPTTFHWHGMKVDADADGGPHNAVPAGETKTVRFTVDQPAATLWYHPHYMGNTARQVYEGMAGLIIVDDDREKSLALPRTYGVDDIPLVIQDRYFTADGRIDYDAVRNPDGTQGDVLLVNGTVKPYVTTSTRWVRYRVVNGSNASNFDIAVGGHRFYQIASDGGLLAAPVPLTSLRLSPGERAEIVVDMGEYSAGDTAHITVNGANALTVHIADTKEDTAFSPDMSLENPEALPPAEELNRLSKKYIELQGMGPMVGINGNTFDMNRIDQYATLGTQEIWVVTNPATMMGGMIHPFHMHGVQFCIVSRNGQAPPPQEQGWKDTVLVNPDETVELLVRYEHTGIFMFHCHNLEHEENGMMGQFRVEESK